MLLALVLMNIMHPGLVLRGPDSDFPHLTRKEKKALKQQKKQEKAQRKADKKSRKHGGSGYEMYDSVVEEDTPRRTEGRYEAYREYGREEHERH
jgi:hypothetical protein